MIAKFGMALGQLDVNCGFAAGVAKFGVEAVDPRYKAGSTALFLAGKLVRQSGPEKGSGGYMIARIPRHERSKIEMIS